MTLASFVSDKHATTLGGLAIALSLTAVAWNYFFNIWFDGVYGLDKHNRTLKVRIIHSLAFEIGIILVSTPMIMWSLDITLIEAFIIDLMAMGVFFVFTIVFNWCYDTVRYQIVSNQKNNSR
jgi:uncharacterized membrane protein